MPILKITDSQVVSYDEYGAGPGLMLVHGSPASLLAWLIGRDDGSGLRMSGDAAARPVLPPWR